MSLKWNRLCVCQALVPHNQSSIARFVCGLQTWKDKHGVCWLATWKSSKCLHQKIFFDLLWLVFCSHNMGLHKASLLIVCVHTHVMQCTMHHIIQSSSNQATNIHKASHSLDNYLLWGKELQSNSCGPFSAHFQVVICLEVVVSSNQVTATAEHDIVDLESWSLSQKGGTIQLLSPILFSSEWKKENQIASLPCCGCEPFILWWSLSHSVGE